jgi:hypothetical protein
MLPHIQVLEKPWFRCGPDVYAGAQGEPAMTEAATTTHDDRPKGRNGAARDPQDQCRLRYLTHLRSEHRHSPRAAADADHTSAKAALLRLRIAEKKRELIPLEEAVGHMDEVVGLFVSRLSGFAARCGGRDLAARRVIDQAVYACGLRFPKPRPIWRISAANLH